MFKLFKSTYNLNIREKHKTNDPETEKGTQE